jgi:hypothetical protein
MRVNWVLLLVAFICAITQSKKTVLFQTEAPVFHLPASVGAPKKLKEPNVQKADSRNCLFEDLLKLNYACLETSIDLKVGWEIKQKWQVASDINPAEVVQYTGTAPAAAFTYVAPNAVTNVGYKYRLRFQPYSVFFFNARPHLKIDRLFMGESQFNVDQFKSFFYFDVVFYQKAIKYDYPGNAKPAA